MKKIKISVLCILWIMAVQIISVLGLPSELIDLDNLDSPASMTKGLLPEAYYGILNFLSHTWRWFLGIVIVISVVIIIVLLGRFLKRVLDEHL